MREEKKKSKLGRIWLKNRFQKFKTQIREGPFQIYVFCNKCLYRRSVPHFRFESYRNLNESILFCVHSHDGKLHICLTCDKKIE